MFPSRREFLERTLALAAGIPGMGVLAAGCGRPADEAPPAGSPELGPIEPELNIYNWSDYIAPNVVPDFEKEFGVRVTYDTFESGEEMVAKLQAGATGYDLIVCTNYLLPVLMQANLLAPLSRTYLSHLGNIGPLFRKLAFDPDDAFTVPWAWGLSGVAWRRDLVASAPEGWGVFLDARYKGKMTMLDDQRDVIGAFLRYRGRSLNSVDPAELEAALRDAVAAKANLKAYISAPVKSQLIAGDVWIAQLWDGDAAQAKQEQPAIEWLLPREGAAMYVDCLIVPRPAPHPRAAHEFINYILRPEVAASIATAIGYGTPNRAAMPLITNTMPYPSENDLARIELQEDLGRASGLWDDLWTRIKTA